MVGTTWAIIENKTPTYPVGGNNVAYTPVPLPLGHYEVSTEYTSSPELFGGGFHIDVSVPTPVNGVLINMNDFYFHPGPYANSWGCPVIEVNPAHGGSEANWDQVRGLVEHADFANVIIQ